MTLQLYKEVDSCCIRLELCVNRISVQEKERKKERKKESAMQGLLTVNIVVLSTRNKTEDLILSRI